MEDKLNKNELYKRINCYIELVKQGKTVPEIFDLIMDLANDPKNPLTQEDIKYDLRHLVSFVSPIIHYNLLKDKHGKYYLTPIKDGEGWTVC